MDECTLITLQGLDLNLLGVHVELGVRGEDGCRGLCVSGVRGTLLGNLLCGIFNSAG
jgi:hypothetical protein